MNTLPLLVMLREPDVESLLKHATAQQRRAVEGGGSYQFWTRVIAALRDTNPNQPAEGRGDG